MLPLLQNGKSNTEIYEKEMRCNPDVCPNCEYHSDGDSFCDLIGEIVLEDWEPTEHYMGPGCPYRKAQKVKPSKKRRKKK